MTRDELLAMWREAATERERAQLEIWLWETATREERRAMPSFERWLPPLLGISAHAVRARRAVLNLGDAGGALWALADGAERASIESVAKLAARAKLRQTAEAVPIAEAVRREVAEYLTWPVAHLPAGTTFRRAPQRTRRGVATKRGASPGRDRWATVRAAIWRVVDAELDGLLDMHARGQLRSQAEAEVQAVVDLLVARVRNARETAALNGTPAAALAPDRKALREACAALGVDPPRGRAEVDHALYVAAKRNYRRLAREYHPDVSGTADSRPRYQAVVEAFVRVEQSYQRRGGPAAVAATGQRNGEEQGDGQHGNGSEG